MLSFKQKEVSAGNRHPKTEFPIPMVDAPKTGFALTSAAYPAAQTGQAFLFLLTVSLIEKGQKRNNQTAKGNQQANYPYKYQNDIRS